MFEATIMNDVRCLHGDSQALCANVSQTTQVLPVSRTLLQGILFDCPTIESVLQENAAASVYIAVPECSPVTYQYILSHTHREPHQSNNHKGFFCTWHPHRPAVICSNQPKTLPETIRLSRSKSNSKDHSTNIYFNLQIWRHLPPSQVRTDLASAQRSTLPLSSSRLAALLRR